MRAVNLLVLSQGFEAVPKDLLPDFEAQLCEREEPLDGIKPHEAACVRQLVHDARSAGATDPKDLDGFAYSFRIPQVSSEFDLLKVAADAVLNIELKAVMVGEERVRRQLARNRYYLGPLHRRTFTFTYVLEPRALYELCDDGAFSPVGMGRLVEVLGALREPYVGRLEALFRAGDYLVSPLNDTRDFIAGKYFLTNHQEQIKAGFLRACEAFWTSPAPAGGTLRRGAKPAPPAFVVYGSAGTGKTLLLYDLARSLGTARPVCVVHCGVLVAGHHALNQVQDRFVVVPAKGSERLDLSDFGAVMIDEAQRMLPAQLQGVVRAARQCDLPLFLSVDYRQILGLVDRRGNDEGALAVGAGAQDDQGGPDGASAESTVRATYPQLRTWRLSHRIRTNKALVGFIGALFGLHGHKGRPRTSHVKVAYAVDAAHAARLVEAFCTEGYVYIRLGVGTCPEVGLGHCPTTNEVVGQEFDRVVMAVGPEFSVWPQAHQMRDARDAHKGQHASDHRLAIYREHVFQGVTRARNDLALVVFDNFELLSYLLA